MGDMVGSGYKRIRGMLIWFNSCVPWNVMRVLL